MDLKLSASDEAFRDEFRAWLRANLPEPWTDPLTDEDARRRHTKYLREWQRTLYGGGWAGITWPREYGGRGASVIESAIYQEELALADTPPQVGTIGQGLVGPTIIAVGTEAQKKQFPSRILSGEHIWCQGFSEPNAGSDVAGLATRAVLDGEEFVVNGQKIWTSGAQISDWCMLLVRTDPDVPKHKGITSLLVDMKSEGIEVRPIRQMSSDSGFNEIFFTDVRVPRDNVLGEINTGWRTAIATLMNERSNLGTGAYIGFKRNFDALVERARSVVRGGVPVARDPIARQKCAQACVELEVFRHNMNRTLSRVATGGVPGPEGSILKLYWSEMNQRISRTAMEVLGDVAQLTDEDDGRWVYNFLRSRGNTIEAGTSEIQRNIIAQRVLGLPRSY